MSIEKQLHERSGSVCEFCGATDQLSVYQVEPVIQGDVDQNLLVCSNCLGQINNPETMDANHWRCLNDSMWSQVPGVQIMAYRLLHRLSAEGWPVGLLDMLYLDDETLTRAKYTGEGTDAETVEKHKDSNGAELQSGDTVVLIKDLNVKGTSMVAKRGTAVRNISLVHDNPEQIEGRVNGQQIVILTQFVKKS